MGRTIYFHALPEDLSTFLEFVSARDPVIVTVRDSDSPEIEAVMNPAEETRVLTLWNQEFLPELKREAVRRPGRPDYYRVPYSQPVLELSPSPMSSWKK